MILNSVHLKNFRSHKDTKLNFSGELNFIIGGNGQGKTSILEAIYYLCTTKSNNSKSDIDAVRFNEKEFEVEGHFKDITEDFVRIFYSISENKKYYYQNGKQVTRSAEIIGRFPVVILTPSDHSITQGSPGDRRKFVDSVISQASDTYLKILLDYNKTLRHRSSLLTKIKEQKRHDLMIELNAWTDKLISSGIELIRHRIKFINEFRNFIKESYKIIMEGNEIPEISYTIFEGNPTEDIERGFKELLNKKREEELRRASNLVGPHRDDFIFEINNMNLKNFGSQGQHKTFQTALRFAQFFYLKDRTGKTPLFLLDDVFGELDKNRSVKISEYLKYVGQAYITLTDFTNFSFFEKSSRDSIIQLSKGEAIYA